MHPEAYAFTAFVKNIRFDYAFNYLILYIIHIYYEFRRTS